VGWTPEAPLAETPSLWRSRLSLSPKTDKTRPIAFQGLAAEALARDPAGPILEFEGEWFTWGQVRRIADQIAELVEASGAPDQATVALIARNRPSLVAALLELIRQGRVIQMVYAFQSGPALARDIRRLAPAIVIAAAEDFPP